MIGTSLSHYGITAKLGQGGMGEVYAAWDTKLDRDVALKVLPADAAASPERRRRFQLEAKAIAGLSHPNLVAVYAVEEANGVHFIVMELVKGQTLTRSIPHRGMALAEFLRVARSICEAVSAAHDLGVIHRDLKPHNVMLSDSGQVKVLDFGLAKLQSELRAPETDETATTSGTREGQVLGTTAYLSPEQAEAKDLDHRSDVFSLGIVFYEMLTGARPFRGDSAAAVISAILRDDPPPLADVRRDIPSDVGRIVRRCLAKDPERRFQSVKDLRNELEELEQEVASGSRPAAERSGDRPLGRRRRLPRPALVVAVATALTLAIAAAFALLGRPSETDGPGPLVVDELTTRPGWEVWPTLAPDGDFYAYSYAYDESFDIWIGTRAGGDPLRLTDDASDDLMPRWSPDGRQIAFLADRGGGTAVYLIPPLGGAQRKVADLGVPWLESPAPILIAFGANPWSPDGRHLVLARSGEQGVQGLWRVDIENGEETRLTEGNDFSASWSWDGDRLTLSPRSGHPLGGSTLRMGVRNGKATSKEVHG